MLGKVSLEEFHGPLTDLMDKLQGDDGPEWLDGFKRFLRKEDVWSPRPKLLTLFDDAALKGRQKSFDPRKFFRNNEGIFVANDLGRTLTNKPVQIVAGPAMLDFAVLTSGAFDRDIKAELSEPYEVELWQIGELLKTQMHGGIGPLSRDGEGNIFYIAGAVLGVYYSTTNHRWRIHGWEPNFIPWDKGARVFVPSRF
jgi:hypothetical protein